MPNVLSPRDLVFRPDNMDETVTHTQENTKYDLWTCQKVTDALNIYLLDNIYIRFGS